MKHLVSKISRVLVLYILLFSSVVTLVLTAIQLRLDYIDGIQVIEQRIQQIELTNSDSITQALWTLDSASIRIQIEGLVRLNDIIYVQLTDQNNQQLSAAGKNNSHNSIKQKIILNKTYRGQETFLGTLTVVATKANVYQKLIDTVIVILISQGIKTFLVSLFVLFIFYYLVTRHLEKIAAHSAAIELSKVPANLVLDRKDSRMQRDDELDRVVAAINRMSLNVFHAYNDLLNNQYKLAEREAKFSAMFDSIPDVIVITDSQRRIIQTNPAFYAEFGFCREDIVGRTTSILYANPEEFDRQGSIRYNASAKISPSVFEIDYRRKDSSTFPGETLGGAIKLADGTLLGYVGIIRDVSVRKNNEVEKLRLQKQLSQAQKMEAIGQLTGGIAHDFNNILASILGYSELILDLLNNSSETKLKQYMERISNAGERARDLVAQLLAFSRGAPGDPKPMKLPLLVDDVTSLIRPTIPSSIKIITLFDEAVPEVLMDNTQMHQILMNLCINARDAMQGKGKLTIKLSYNKNVHEICQSCQQSVQGEYVVLTVEDTGSGIDDEILQSIFEPFQSTKEIGKGTGMGLSVVHGILHKHASHIVVKTALNAGSSFQLLIPPIKEQGITFAVEQPPAEQVSHSDGLGKHILVVDDEMSVSVFLKDFLESYDYKVTALTSSLQAIELFREQPANFDLIITDQTMPEVTGLEMIKKMFDIRKDIPVILCSGYNELISEEQVMQLGISKYLTKPVNNQLMLKSVQSSLK